MVLFSAFDDPLTLMHWFDEAGKLALSCCELSARHSRNCRMQ